MKNSQEEALYSNGYSFHRQKANKSPINKSNSNNFVSNQYNNAVIISKLQINFPKMKYCQSKKDVLEESFEQEIQKQFGFNKDKQTFRTNLNYTPQQTKKGKLPFHSTKKQRSPVRFSEFSYQQTTKQDNSENVSSYHDFFKVPIQAQNCEIKQQNSVEGSNNWFQIQKRKIINNIRRQQGNQCDQRESSSLYNQANFRNNFGKQASPSINNRIQQNLNEKQYKKQQNFHKQTTLSQLLNDLQHRSQKLYEMFGQNSQDYQRCLQTIQKTENLSKIQMQKKNIDKRSYENIYTDDIAKDKHIEANLERQTQKRQNFISSNVYTPQKCIKTPQGKRQLKQTDKKKKVLFFSSQNSEQRYYQNSYRQESNFQKRKKIKQFIEHLDRFFKVFLINTLRSRFYYQTGILSTQSIIHSPIKYKQRSEQKNGQGWKNEKETSFFVDYFDQQKRSKKLNQQPRKQVKSQSYQVRTNQKGLSKQILNHNEQKQDQKQSQYFGSKGLKQKIRHKIDPNSDRFAQISGKQVPQKNTSDLQQFEQSYMKKHLNSSGHGNLDELLIQSKNKPQLCYGNKQRGYRQQGRQQSIKRHGKNINQAARQQFRQGFQKLSSVLKYKILKIVRFSFLNMKSVDSNTKLSYLLQSPQGFMARITRNAVQNRKQARVESMGILKNQYNPIAKRQINTKAAQKTQPKFPNSKESKTIFSPRQHSNEFEMNKPKNILEHYYKEVSAPNSPNSQYDSIVKTPQTLNKALPNDIFQSKKGYYKSQMSKSRQFQYVPIAGQGQFNQSIPIRGQDHQLQRKNIILTSNRQNMPEMRQTYQDNMRSSGNNIYNDVQQEYFSNHSQQNQISPQHALNAYQAAYPKIQQEEYYPTLHKDSIGPSVHRNLRSLSNNSSKIMVGQSRILNYSRLSNESLHKSQLKNQLKSSNMRQSHSNPTKIFESTPFHHKNQQAPIQPHNLVNLAHLQFVQLSQKLRRSGFVSKGFSPYNSHLVKQGSRLDSMKGSQLHRIPNDKNGSHNSMRTSYMQVQGGFGSNGFGSNGLGTIRPQINNLDYIRMGKISRSYSENDFTMYHQAQGVRPQMNHVYDRNQQVNKIANGQNRPRLSNQNALKSSFRANDQILNGRDRIPTMNPMNRSELKPQYPSLKQSITRNGLQNADVMTLRPISDKKRSYSLGTFNGLNNFVRPSNHMQPNNVIHNNQHFYVSNAALDSNNIANRPYIQYIHDNQSSNMPFIQSSRTFNQQQTPNQALLGSQITNQYFHKGLQTNPTYYGQIKHLAMTQNIELSGRRLIQSRNVKSKSFDHLIIQPKFNEPFYQQVNQAPFQQSSQQQNQSRKNNQMNVGKNGFVLKRSFSTSQMPFNIQNVNNGPIVRIENGNMNNLNNFQYFPVPTPLQNEYKKMNYQQNPAKDIIRNKGVYSPQSSAYSRALNSSRYNVKQKAINNKEYGPLVINNRVNSVNQGQKIVRQRQVVKNQSKLANYGQY